MQEKISEEAKSLLKNGILKINGYKPDLEAIRIKLEKEIGREIKMFIDKNSAWVG